MKRGRSLVLALAAMTLAPLPLLAQGGGMGQGRGPGGMGALMSARLLVEQGSVEYIVAKASADFNLGADQKSKLTEIATAWSATTRETREKAAALMPQPGQGMGGGDREAMMQRFQELQPLAAKLQEEDEKSLAEAMKVLDEVQQEKAKAMLAERLENARPRRPGAGS